MVTHLSATERHLPYEIIHCYLPSNTGERTEPDRPALDLPTADGWKAELKFMVGYILRWFTCP